MPLTLITAPAQEPVSLDEAKTQANIEHSLDNTYINSLIVAARRYCERLLGEALITQTWDLYLDAFPEQITVPKPPLQTVTHIKYKDANGTLQTLSASYYEVDAVSKPGRITQAPSQFWPQTYEGINAVQIRFVCGYGDPEDVEANVKQAILLKIVDLYEHRGDDPEGNSTSLELNARAIEALLGVGPRL